jgi:hypothetical protein
MRVRHVDRESDRRVDLDCRMPEHVVDEANQSIGNGMFEVFCFVMNFGPAHSHDAHEKQLDRRWRRSTMAASFCPAAVNRTPAYGS